MNNSEKAKFLVDRHLMKLAREGKILAYTKCTFPKYEINWHHRYLAQKLNLFLQKKIKRLMVFMPPRNGKSELTSRRLPSMIHGLYPNDEILLASYNSNLASDMLVDVCPTDHGHERIQANISKSCYSGTECKFKLGKKSI